MRIFGSIMRFARSPRGRRMLSRAGRYARSPEGRARLEQARRQIAGRRKRATRPR